MAEEPSAVHKPNLFRDFKTSPEIVRLAVMLYVRFPLSLPNVGDPLHARGVEITVPPLSPSGVVSVLHTGQRHCAC